MTENKDINYKAMYRGTYPNSITSAEVIVPMLVRAVQPQSVLDIGCAIGAWLYVFQKNGVPKVQGVDGSWVLDEHRNELLIDESNIEIHDFEMGGQLKCLQEERFDLAICLEMAEHVSHKKADEIVGTLTKAADVIYFSGATPYSGGQHHVNEQWQSYWVNKFKKHGYEVSDYIRPRVWNNKQVCYFYAEESFVFVKKERLREFPILQNMVSEYFVANVVHPIHFKDQIIKPTHDWSYLLSMQKKLLNAYIQKAKIEWSVRKN